MKRQNEERYNKDSGHGENTVLERFILSQIFQTVSEPINNRSLQIQGCDYICRYWNGKDYVIDAKEDYADSKGDFLFEIQDRFGYSWTQSKNHIIDYILWIKNSEGKAYIIWYNDLVKFSKTETFRKRKAYPTGEKAISKFFRLGTEIPYRKVFEFYVIDTAHITKAMSDEKKYANN